MRNHSIPVAIAAKSTPLHVVMLLFPDRSKTICQGLQGFPAGPNSSVGLPQACTKATFPKES